MISSFRCPVGQDNTMSRLRRQKSISSYACITIISTTGSSLNRVSLHHRHASQSSQQNRRAFDLWHAVNLHGTPAFVLTYELVEAPSI